MLLSLHYATVVDNNDPDQKAKIQVRILPEMKDMEAANLPWVRPFINNGMSSDQYSYNPPENDSKIWVVFTDQYYHEGYYLTGAFIDGFFNFSSIQSTLSSVSELSDSSYTNIRFSRLPDGTVIFHNDDTGEVGIKHSSGKYIVLDSNGDMTISGDQTTKGDAAIEGNTVIDGDLSVGGPTALKQPLTLYTALETAMSSLLLILATHIHLDPLTGTTGPPQPPLTTTTTSTIGLQSAESLSSESD